jgi:hypothetical protein
MGTFSDVCNELHDQINKLKRENLDLKVEIEEIKEEHRQFKDDVYRAVDPSDENRWPYGTNVFTAIKNLVPAPGWTPKQIDVINYEMQEGVIRDIRDKISVIKKDQGESGDMSATPPMFFPEAIHNIYAREKQKEKEFRALAKRVYEAIRGCEECEKEGEYCDGCQDSLGDMMLPLRRIFQE